MRKSIFFILLIALTTHGIVNAQNKEESNEKNYYWFNLKIKSVIHKDTHKPALATKRIYKKINSGTFIEFAESYQKSISDNKVTIGPYESKELAKKAQKCYQLSKISESKLAEKFIKNYQTDNDTYYWYFSRIKFDKDDGSVIFERIPARVTSGSLKEFLEIEYEGLSFTNFLIGPFRNHLNAEKSKYIFRKYGELNSTGTENGDNVPKELKKMAQKWKNKDIEIKATIVEVKANEARVKIALTFPKEYFEKNAAQYLELVIMENKKMIYPNASSTFQGEAFEDNNGVVLYEEASTKSFDFRMPYSKINSCKLLLISTLITNQKILKCENIYLELEGK